MKNLKGFVKYAIGFVIGVVLTLVAIRVFILPGLTMDIGKLSLEGAARAYNLGVRDTMENTQTFYDYFDEDELNEAINWEYRFIK